MHKRLKPLFLASWALAPLALTAPLTAAADTYPDQPLTMLVSFPPGGATDMVARAMAMEMGKDLDQSVVVVNRAGAGGSIGTAAIADAKPDGNTFGLISVAALTILPNMQSVSYSLDDFRYVCQAYDIPVVVVVAPDSPFQTLDELVAHAKANPGKLNYATVGPGSLPNMAALDWMRAAGIDMNHVPYKGEGPAVTDLLGGHVDLYLGTNAAATRSGLHRLAVASAERPAEIPEVPTLREAGYDVTWSIIGGILAPAGMNDAHRNRLEQACERAAGTDAYQNALANLNILPLYANGADFRRNLERESELNRSLLESVGLLKP